jgi:Methyltransferase domain
MVERPNSPACAFCGGPCSRVWLGDRFRRCPNCGLISRNRLPSERELNELYAAWVNLSEKSDTTGATDPALARQYAQSVAAALGWRDFDHLRVIDFGAGSGLMADALRALGAETVAVDLYRRDYLEARGYYAVRTLEELPADVRFAGICAVEVLEHLTETVAHGPPPCGFAGTRWVAVYHHTQP